MSDGQSVANMDNIVTADSICQVIVCACHMLLCMFQMYRESVNKLICRGCHNICVHSISQCVTSELLCAAHMPNQCPENLLLLSYVVHHGLASFCVGAGQSSAWRKYMLPNLPECLIACRTTSSHSEVIG